jgi:hypothetical protein
MDGFKSGYTAATADRLRALRSGRDDKGSAALLFGRLATWMDGFRSGYTAATADRLRALLTNILRYVWCCGRWQGDRGPPGDWWRG